MVKVTHEALEKRLPFACEFRVVLPDGSIRWIYEVGRHILNDSGKPVRVIGLGMDITQRKNAQEELRIAHDRMKQFVDANVVGLLPRLIAAL
jgi:PAS domain S-box-containing protein